MIPGGGASFLVIPTAASRPCPIPSSHPHIEKPGKQAGGGAWRDGFGDRIPAGNGGQASKTRTANDLTPFPIIRRSHDAHTGFISYRHQHNRPAPRQAQRDDGRDAGARERDGERQGDKTSTWTTETSTRDDGTKTRAPARRQANNKTHNETTNETHDNKTEDETRRRRQGQKQARMGDENMRSGKNKTPHFLTFRPTPSRRLSIIRRPQSVPPPPVGG